MFYKNLKLRERVKSKFNFTWLSQSQVRKRLKHKTNFGFTLIELLIVIAIIGLLSSVVLASLNSARKKARDARRISDIAQFQKVLEFYYDANNSYPVIAQSADHVNCESRFPTLDTYLGPYMSTMLHDPLGPPPGGSIVRIDFCYFYNVKNSGQGYVIMTYSMETAEAASKGEGTRCYGSDPFEGHYTYCKGVNY